MCEWLIVTGIRIQVSWECYIDFENRVENDMSKLLCSFKVPGAGVESGWIEGSFELSLIRNYIIYKWLKLFYTNI